MIQVTRTVESPLVAKRALMWPPTVRSNQVASLEGVPQRIGVYQRFARVGTTEITMFVFFGRAHPSASNRVANDELKIVPIALSPHRSGNILTIRVQNAVLHPTAPAARPVRPET